MNRHVRVLAGVVAVLVAASRSSAEDAARLAPAVERWYTSLGGFQAVLKVHTLEVNETVEEGPAKEAFEARALRYGTDRIRLDIQLPERLTLTQAFDGNVGWTDAGTLGQGRLQPFEVFRLFLENDPFLSDILQGLVKKSSGPVREKRGGADYDVYTVDQSVGGTARWYFNAATGYLERIEGGFRAGTLLTLGDYRRVNDISAPFEFRFEADGKTVVTVHRKDMRINPPLGKEYFSLLPWESQSMASAQKILDRYISSCADPARFAEIKTRVLKATMDSTSTGVRASRVVMYKSPSKILVETDTRGIGKDVTGFDGKTGWALSELQGFHVLKDSEVGGLFGELSPFGDPRIEFEAPLRRIVGRRNVRGRAATAITLSTVKGPIGTFYFDDANGDLLRIASSKRDGASNKPIATVDYDDFRKVDGLDVPFLVTQTTASNQVVTKVDSLQNNVPVDDAVFAPRRDD